jgi:endoglucanase
VQEEVGLRGGKTSSEKILPALAVVIDVTHAQTLDTKNQVSINLDKGPVLTIGPNIHPELLKGMTQAAEENRIPYQIQPTAGPTGTDARIIQLAGHGIPTALLSVPLRYMHTSVETASIKDIADCGKLLAYYIASLPEDLEELSWS